MDLPKLAILVTTYVPQGAKLRIEAIQKTAASWKRNLRYDGEIHVHVADDGSDHQYDAGFWMGIYDWANSFSYGQQQRRGVGASLNAGFQACFDVTPLVLYAVDDWSLVQSINLTPWAEVLMMGQPNCKPQYTLGCIRFVTSPSLRGGELIRCNDVWGIVWERYTYIWAQRPALYHKRFIDAYGKFPEMEKAVEVDRIYNNTVLAKEDGPEIMLALVHQWQHLWSIEAGDVVPPASIPPDRFKGEVNTWGMPKLV